MSYNYFLFNNRAHAIRWAKTSDGLSEIITTNGIYYSKRSPMDLLKDTGIRSQFILQTEPSDHIDCVWILNLSFKTYKVEENLTDVIFDDGTSLLIPVGNKYIDEKRTRLHTFTYDEGEMNYIFPSIKEFNQYYSIVYKRKK
ncbi:hypothetical protein [Sporosarcina sp. UB5]|uniref:hypothetical protein n=1 Tax=Sporosarcina sp. UB5 TaxID=3047463 RepID=UPI003D7C123C